jgi:hypothetical protein
MRDVYVLLFPHLLRKKIYIYIYIYIYAIVHVSVVITTMGDYKILSPVAKFCLQPFDCNGGI